MTSPSDKPDNRENSGLSPVIGIIMLVAITVALAGVIGFFATEMTQNQGASGVADVETEKHQMEISRSVSIKKVLIQKE